MLRNEFTRRTSVVRDAASAFVNLRKFSGYATRVEIYQSDMLEVRADYIHHWTVLARATETAHGGVDIVFTDCNGYRSVTTAARIRAILAEFGFYLSSERGTWFVGSELHNEEIPFRDGLSLSQLRALNLTIRTERRERSSA